MAQLIAGAPLRWCDLVKEYEEHGDEMRAAMDNVCKTAAFILGPDVQDLETKLAAYVGARHCISVGSGTVAIEVLLRAMGVGAGDEVITVPFTWISTAECISLVGAKPVFVDVEADSFNMDPKKLEAAIKPGVTKAILCVSFHGQVSKVDEIAAVAAKFGVPVLEDGAQSFGGTRGGVKSCGPIPGLLASTTSFYPAKPYGCYGDGGAIFTSDDALAGKIKAIRTYGGVVRDSYEIIGTNARLDTIQAAVLNVKLKYYPSVLAQRQQVAAWYHEELAGCGAVLPTTVAGNTHTFAQYTIGVAAAARQNIMNKLKEHGIHTGVYYATPLHQQKCFADLGYKRGTFPVSEWLCDTVLSIPIHQYVTHEQVKVVSAAIRAAITEFNGALQPYAYSCSSVIASTAAAVDGYRKDRDSAGTTASGAGAVATSRPPSTAATAHSTASHAPYFKTADGIPSGLQLPTLTSLSAPDAPKAFVHPTAVVDAGAQLGPGTRVWHFAHVCSSSVIGGYCNLGQNTYIANGVTIGNYCKIQNNVSVYEGVHIADEVFLGPSCVFTNDLTPRAVNYGDKWAFTETYVSKGVSIGANATIVCGHTLGEYCTIGAGATVTHNVPPHALMVGCPAKQIGWMSKAGFKLDLPAKLAPGASAAEATCPVSGERYRVEPSGALTLLAHGQ